MTKRDVDLVVSGAGSDGIIESAAMRVIRPYVNVIRPGGSSAGALLSLGDAAGKTDEEMLGFWRDFLTDGGLEDWKSPIPGIGRVLGMAVGPGHGMIRGREIRQRLGQVFGDMKMGDLLKPCRVKVGHVNRRKTVTIDSQDERHKGLLVADVGMASSSVPFIIDARPIDPKDPLTVYTDGGVGDNTPRSLWDDVPDRPTLVLSFADSDDSRPARSLKGFVAAVMNIQRDASEDAVSLKPAWRVWECRLPSSGGGLDFTLDSKECDKRVELGNNAALAFVSGMIRSGLLGPTPRRP